ncbi:MAG: S8 family serine peptidase [Verrucomicrobiae bacterium]|nr:S8 family serine peptidase [Verrucomicrobiae bacterium]
MPESVVGIGATSPVSPGNIRLHDAESQATTEVPVPPTVIQQTLPSQGGGYSGVDGARGSEMLPANFGAMSLIPSASRAAFPWRVNCKLAMRWVNNSGSSVWYVASGTMIDAETAVTAGHCVYNRDAAFSANPWAQEVYVYPGWDGGDTLIPASSTMYPYGWGRGTLFGSWSSYTDSGNFDFDLGVIRLDRAVGALTGWFGWEYGFDCLANVYNNTSYPAESCGGGLHTGRDMYYGSGNWDACNGNNGTMWQVNTSPGCLTAVWGGMSGSSAYRFDGNNRYIGAICSLSDRSTRGYYARFFQGWVDYVWGAFIPTYSRGTTFDLQPLNQQVGVNSIPAGGTVTGLSHLQVNATDADPGPATYTFRVYLSNNDFISTADTLLGTYSYSWDFAPMGSVTVNMLDEVIPAGTPPGTYWIGVLLEPGTDADASNDNMEGWDARQITVTSDGPSNDNWVNAIGLPSPPTTTTGNNVGATTEPNEQELTIAGATVWWYIQAPAGGTMTIDTFGSDFDTMLHIYTGFENGFANLIPVANNDDAGGGLQSQVTFSVNAGQYYEIRAAGYFGAQGNIQLNVGPVDGGEPDIRITPLTLDFVEPSETSIAAASQNLPVTAPAQTSAPVDKLLNPIQIMEGFTEGQTVRVVVNLNQPAQTQAAIDFNSAVSLKPWQAALKAHQDEVIADVPPGLLQVRFHYENISAFSAEVTWEALEALRVDPRVSSIEPVYILEAHLNQGIPLMNALASRPTYNGSGLAIAICDTGVDYTHPQLGGGGFPNTKVLGGYDFGDLDSNPAPNGNAHGTACAGIAAGELETVGDYIGGVAPGAKIYALKISSGSTGSATSDAMIAAWDWCVSHKDDDPANPIMVISTSFGGGRYFANCDTVSPGMTAAADNAVAAGITVLVSSGNNGYCDSMGWPACISSVISVGAVYDAGFGHYYPCIDAASCAPKIPSGGCSTGYYADDTTAPDKVTSYSNMASFLGLLAPANQCYTLDISGSAGYSTGDYASGFGGTSAACPYAAGAVAALQAAAMATTGSYLTPAEVKNQLLSTGDLITDTKVAITKPRVNLGSAIAALSSTGQPIRIYNDGTGSLTVNSITPETLAPWISVMPSGPFNVSPGDYQDVTVNVDFSLAPSGESTVRLLVASNDPDKNPYPGGVYVYVTTALPTVTVAATDSTAGEPGTGEGTGTFTFSRTASTAAALTVNFNVAGTATSGTDFTAIGTTVDFAAGSATATKVVSVNDDSELEAVETVEVTLATGTGYTVGTPSSATVTITDDDAVVTVTATDATAGEPSDSGTFTFTRTGFTIPALTVNFTAGGTATSGTDYTAIGNSVNFVAGSATATKTVSVIDDTEVEGDETVEVTLAAGAGYTIGVPFSAIVVIADNDEEVSAAAKPRLLSIAESPEGFFTLIWQVHPGRTYRFEVKTNLTDTIWTTLGADFTAEASSVVTTNSVGADIHRFYRVLDVTDH